MFLKNKNIIFKIRRSKVTDYAALKVIQLFFILNSKEKEVSTAHKSNIWKNMNFLFVG